MNIAVKLIKQNFTEQALKPRERKIEQIKNRPHTENVDSPEKVRLNPEFDKIIKEIVKQNKKDDSVEENENGKGIFERWI